MKTKAEKISHIKSQKLLIDFFLTDCVIGRATEPRA
jgi:hypothetical protein